MCKKDTLLVTLLALLIIIVTLYALKHASESQTLNIDGNAQQQGSVVKQNEGAYFSGNNYLVAVDEAWLMQVVHEKSYKRQLTLLKKHLSVLNHTNIVPVALYFSDLNPAYDRYTTFNALVIDYWAALSVSEALEFSENNLPLEVQKKAMTSVVLRECSDAKVVNNCVAGLPQSNTLDSVLVSIATNILSHADHSNAITWASAISDDDGRTNMMNLIVTAWVTQEPEAAFEWAIVNREYIAIGRQAINEITKRDPWQAYHLITYLPGGYDDLKMEMYNSILDNLVGLGDFQTIMPILESVSQYDSIADVGQAWIELDPKAALQWSLGSPDFKSLSLRAVNVLSKEDPWSAYEITSQMSVKHSALQQNMFRLIFSALGKKQDFSTIMSMVDRISVNENRAHYYEVFINRWARIDAKAATDAILSLPPSEQKSAFITKSIRYWSQNEPLEAIALSRSLGGGELQIEATSGALRGWAKSSPTDLLNWLNTEPVSSLLDSSVAVASNALLGSSKVDPDVIVQLAGNINNESLRLSTLDAIASYAPSDLERDMRLEEE